MRRLGCKQKCPVCKDNAQCSVDAADIQARDDKPPKPAITAICDLDIKNRDAVKQSFTRFKEELQKNIDVNLMDIETRVTMLEQTSTAAVDPVLYKN